MSHTIQNIEAKKKQYVFILDFNKEGFNFAWKIFITTKLLKWLKLIRNKNRYLDNLIWKQNVECNLILRVIRSMVQTVAFVNWNGLSLKNLIEFGKWSWNRRWEMEYRKRRVPFQTIIVVLLSIFNEISDELHWMLFNLRDLLRELS